MLANAVSSAVERLYAAVPVSAERSVVSRVSAVSATPRLPPVGEDEVDRNASLREDRERVQQRQALTRGVLAVFESSTIADTLGTPTDAGDGKTRSPAEATMPDPQLEEAILRFIHTMFRSLADVESGAPADATDQPGSATPTDPAGPVADSREALRTRIENLARRFSQPDAAPDASAAGALVAPATSATSTDPARPGASADPVSDSDPTRLPASFGTATEASGPSPQAASLQQAYAEVVQALHANLGDGNRQSQTTRAELVSMMQRLALAMHGAPPIDPGLPTRGGLLSARA